MITDRGRKPEASEEPTLPPDPVIEVYKAHVDRASIRENLKRTPEERIRNLQRLAEFAAELRRAGQVVRSQE